jgi:hypothetical protein
MSRFEGPQGIVTNGLVLNLDAGDPDSYTRSQPPFVEVLVVAGGASGGTSNPANGGGAGGGAGGVIYNSAYQLTNASAITVTVGAGGAGQTSNTTQGNDGSNSVFGSLTAVGGGGGGSASGGNTTGRNGGSGGGAGYVGYYNNFNSGTGTAGQGFRGGYVLANNNAGGGGGAGGVGGDTFDSRPEPGYPAGNGGLGGPGVYYSISGTSTLYSNGGNGGSQNQNTIVSGSGTTGAYGGSGATSTAGSGIVIVRYPGLPAATGGTITYVNGYTIHTFTTSGTFTPYLINDITGNGFNGTLENGVGFNSYQNGGSLIFDGSDDQIPVASSNNFANYSWSNGITVMVAYYIVNILDFNNQFRALMGVTGANRSFNYYLFGPNASSGLLRYHFSSIYGSGFSTDVSISNNTWYIGAFTSNGSTGTYYHNNVAVDTQAMGTQSYTTAGGLQYFGRADNYWQGRIGYWLIYNRALSTTELTQNYNAQKNRFGL